MMVGPSHAINSPVTEAFPQGGHRARVTDGTCSACKDFGQWEAGAPWRLMTPELGALGARGLREGGLSPRGLSPVPPPALPGPSEEQGCRCCTCAQVSWLSQNRLPQPHA